MRVTVLAVGRLKSGPEKDLFDDYCDRFERAGRSMGFSDLRVAEVDTRKASGPRAEAEALSAALPEGDMVVMLDERGRQPSSPKFAEQIAGWRDMGTRGVTFVIGGVEGLDPAFRGRADHLLSLGPMVWPHMLVRVMLAEQLYRAVSILAGSPYHKA